jgi:DNA-binding CsgD family transcriptional regulator
MDPASSICSPPVRGDRWDTAGPPDSGRPGVRPVGRQLGVPTATRIVLDPLQRNLLALLAAGHTDTSAARRLHVSPRTVTNMLRALMNHLGVNNRFQLGVAVGLHSAVWRHEPVPVLSGPRRDR